MKKYNWIAVFLLTGLLSVGLFLHAGRKQQCCVQLKKQCTSRDLVKQTTDTDLQLMPSVIIF